MNSLVSASFLLFDLGLHVILLTKFLVICLILDLEVRQEVVSRIADNPPSYPFGMSLPWHAILVTRWCEAHGTMWRRTGP
jgi:hypothetical protein